MAVDNTEIEKSEYNVLKEDVGGKLVESVKENRNKLLKCF